MCQLTGSPAARNAPPCKLPISNDEDFRQLNEDLRNADFLARLVSKFTLLIHYIPTTARYIVYILYALQSTYLAGHAGRNLPQFLRYILQTLFTEDILRKLVWSKTPDGKPHRMRDTPLLEAILSTFLYAIGLGLYGTLLLANSANLFSL